VPLKIWNSQILVCLKSKSFLKNSIISPKSFLKFSGEDAPLLEIKMIMIKAKAKIKNSNLRTFSKKKKNVKMQNP